MRPRFVSREILGKIRNFSILRAGFWADLRFIDGGSIWLLGFLSAQILFAFRSAQILWLCERADTWQLLAEAALLRRSSVDLDCAGLRARFLVLFEEGEK